MKFSIRDIMLITAIVAVSVVWWLDRYRLVEKAAVDEAKRTAVEKMNDFWTKTVATVSSDNYFLKSQVEQLERENPPRKLPEMNETKKAEIMEMVRDSFNSGRTYTLPGPPVIENPPEL